MGERRSYYGENEEKLLRVEAEAAVREVKFAVDEVKISDKLPNTDEVVFMNLKTKEHEKYCVELSVQGFRVVGKEYDLLHEDSMSQFFETIYALLDHFSPAYRKSFGDALMDKLNQLQNETA